MHTSESPLIHFVRSVALLSILVAVPGIAIFWNHLPKNMANLSAPMKSCDMPATDFCDVSNFVEQPLIQQMMPAPPILEQSKAALEQELALLERHLQSLGATHQQLQTWGNRGKLYRFVCHVALPGTSFTRPFDATGSDPVAIIKSVIADVEQWRLQL